MKTSKISKNYNLVLSNLYHYDIVACNYYISEFSNLGIVDIKFEDKKSRNIDLGKAQTLIGNLSTFFLTNTDSIVQANSEDRLITQRDGIITTHPLDENGGMFKLRYTISKLISSIDRSKYLIIKSNNEVEVKGVRNKPIDTSFYNLFSDLDFCDKSKLMTSLSSMRYQILNSTNNKWFSFENEDQSYTIRLKNNSEVFVSKSTIKRIDSNEINKTFLWEEYIWPFIQPLIIQYN